MKANTFQTLRQIHYQKLDKYISQFGKTHFKIQTNTEKNYKNNFRS